MLVSRLFDESLQLAPIGAVHLRDVLDQFADSIRMQVEDLDQIGGVFGSSGAEFEFD